MECITFRDFVANTPTHWGGNTAYASLRHHETPRENTRDTQAHIDSPTEKLIQTIKKKAFLPHCDIHIIEDTAKIQERLKSISSIPYKSKDTGFDIGLDCEYEQHTQIDPSQPYGVYAGEGIKDTTYRQWHNVIQSYQLTVRNRQSGHVAQVVIIPHKTNHDGKSIHEEHRRLFFKQILIIGMYLAGLTPQQMSVRTTDGKKAKPIHITVVWHWGSAEMASLRDRERLVKSGEIIILGGAVVTLKSITTSLPLDRENKHNKPVIITLRDSNALMDKDSSRKLYDLGKTLEWSKKDLSQEEKQHISRLLHGDSEDFTRFIDYGITDTEIALLWGLFMEDMASTTLGLSRHIPMTTGTIATERLKLWYPDLRKRFALCRRLGKWVPMTERKDDEGFIRQCFYGGMNQTFKLWKQEGIIIDIDINSAYPSTYPLLLCIDWKRPPDTSSTNPDDYIEPYHFATGTFTFPSDTPFPCLPVYTPNGLVFPLSSSNVNPGPIAFTDAIHMNGPEIQLARQLGADVKIIKGRRFHTLDEPLFADCARALIELRTQYDKKDPRNKMIKLITNSIYGKTAQGISERLTRHELYDDDDDYDHYLLDKTPYCSISLPHAASAITAMIRATLNICMIEASKLGADVLSATTDGAMLRLHPTTTPDATIKQFMDNLHTNIATYPLVQHLLEGRKYLGLHDDLLEVKSYPYGPKDPETGEQPYKTSYGTMAYTWKTRMNCLYYHEHLLNEARTGFTKDTTRPDYVSSQTLMDLEGVTEPYVHATLELTTLQDIRERKAKDIVSYRQESVLNIAPDWKRHFATDGTSTPWEDMTIYYQVRHCANRLRGAAWPKQVHAIPRPESSMTPDLDRDIKEITHRIATKAEGFILPHGISVKHATTILGINRKTFERARNKPHPHTGWTPHSPEALHLMEQLGLLD